MSRITPVTSLFASVVIGGAISFYNLVDHSYRITELEAYQSIHRNNTKKLYDLEKRVDTITERINIANLPQTSEQEKIKAMAEFEENWLRKQSKK